MHFPCLIVCPRIVIRLVRIKGSLRRDEDIDIAFRRVLHASYVCYFLGTQGLLRCRFIDLAIGLDMQIIVHVGIECTDLAVIITAADAPPCALIVTERLIFRAVTSAYRYLCSRHDRIGIGCIDRLCPRQDELIEFPGTDRSLHNEQVGIL